MASRQTKEKWRRHVARRIRELRRAASLTQEQLAEKADIAPQYLSRVENCRNAPSLDTIVSLAEALGTTPSLMLAEPWEAAGDHPAGEWPTSIVLAEEDTAFVESQLAAWLSHLSKRGSDRG